MGITNESIDMCEGERGPNVSLESIRNKNKARISKMREQHKRNILLENYKATEKIIADQVLFKKEQVEAVAKEEKALRELASKARRGNLPAGLMLERLGKRRGDLVEKFEYLDMKEQSSGKPLTVVERNLMNDIKRQIEEIDKLISEAQKKLEEEKAKS